MITTILTEVNGGSLEITGSSNTTANKGEHLIIRSRSIFISGFFFFSGQSDWSDPLRPCKIYKNIFPVMSVIIIRKQSLAFLFSL